MAIDMEIDIAIPNEDEIAFQISNNFIFISKSKICLPISFGWYKLNHKTWKRFVAKLKNFYWKICMNHFERWTKWKVRIVFPCHRFNLAIEISHWNPSKYYMCLSVANLSCITTKIMLKNKLINGNRSNICADHSDRFLHEHLKCLHILFSKI